MKGGAWLMEATFLKIYKALIPLNRRIFLRSVFTAIWSRWLICFGTTLSPTPNFTSYMIVMYTKFVFEFGKVWQSVVWPSRRRCAPLRQFRLCVFSNIWGNDAMLQLVQHMILLRTLLCMRTIFVHGLGVVNVLIGQLLRRDPRESAAGYNDGV